MSSQFTPQPSTAATAAPAARQTTTIEQVDIDSGYEPGMDSPTRPQPRQSPRKHEEFPIPRPQISKVLIESINTCTAAIKMHRSLEAKPEPRSNGRRARTVDVGSEPASESEQSNNGMHGFRPRLQHDKRQRNLTARGAIEYHECVVFPSLAFPHHIASIEIEISRKTVQQTQGKFVFSAHTHTHTHTRVTNPLVYFGTYIAHAVGASH